MGRRLQGRHMCSGAVSPDRTVSAASLSAILVVAVCMVLCIGSVDSASGAEGQGVSDVLPGTYTGRVWERMQNGTSAVQALQDEGFSVYTQSGSAAYGGSVNSAQDSDSLPEWIAEEVIGAYGYQCVIADSNKALLCVLEECSYKEATKRIGEDLSAHGWVQVTGTEDGICSFIKEKGECRWLMMEGIEAEGCAGIVLHIQHV